MDDMYCRQQNDYILFIDAVEPDNSIFVIKFIISPLDNRSRISQGTVNHPPVATRRLPEPAGPRLMTTTGLLPSSFESRLGVIRSSELTTISSRSKNPRQWPPPSESTGSECFRSTRQPSSDSRQPERLGQNRCHSRQTAATSLRPTADQA